MSSIEYVSIVIVGFSLTWVILVTVLFFRALKDSLNHAESIHDRSRAQLDKTLDRLMAMDFQTFKSFELAESAPLGEYVEPAAEEWVPVLMPLETDNAA
jgi:hypothetical protein